MFFGKMFQHWFTLLLGSESSVLSTFHIQTRGRLCIYIPVGSPI